MDSALTQLYGPSGSVGGGIGGAIAAPINAVSSAGTAATHLSLLGVLAFLITLWILVRVAGFRFGVQVSSGVGR